MLTNLIAAFVLIGSLISGGALLTEKYRKNRFVIATCIVFACVSFFYLGRSLLQIDQIYPDAFDREGCLKAASTSTGLYNIRVDDVVTEVKDFRQGAGFINPASDVEIHVGTREEFQIFYKPGDDSFAILLNLIQAPATPESTSRAAAEYLQHELCLTKKQICGLKYRVSAPTATNALFPGISGRNLYFEYCS